MYGTRLRKDYTMKHKADVHRCNDYTHKQQTRKVDIESVPPTLNNQTATRKNHRDYPNPSRDAFVFVRFQIFSLMLVELRVFVFDVHVVVDEGMKKLR